MQQSGQNGDPISSERQVTSRSTGTRRVESGAAVALAALLGIVAASAVGCEGKDSTEFPGQGGSSGSGAGRSGAGGTPGGSSGRGGASGASGTGGATAGTGGANGGTGGATGGSAGTGGTNDGDAGPPDSGSPDAAPELSDRERWAQQLCATGAELDGCEQPDTCEEGVLLLYSDYLEPTVPDCLDEADAYFACVAAQPVTSYECAGDPLTPNFIAGSPPCDDEQVAFDAAFIDPSACVD
jgi:hypothetical protein